jgi:hypothetical protein
MVSHISEAQGKAFGLAETSRCGMKSSTTKYVGAIVLAGALALVAATPSFAQIRTGEEGGNG